MKQPCPQLRNRELLDQPIKLIHTNIWSFTQWLSRPWEFCIWRLGVSCTRHFGWSHDGTKPSQRSRSKDCTPPRLKTDYSIDPFVTFLLFQALSKGLETIQGGFYGRSVSLNVQPYLAMRMLELACCTIWRNKIWRRAEMVNRLVTENVFSEVSNESFIFLLCQGYQ